MHTDKLDFRFPLRALVTDFKHRLLSHFVFCLESTGLCAHMNLWFHTTTRPSFRSHCWGPSFVGRTDKNAQNGRDLSSSQSESLHPLQTHFVSFIYLDSTLPKQSYSVVEVILCKCCILGQMKVDIGRSVSGLRLENNLIFWDKYWRILSRDGINLTMLLVFILFYLVFYGCRTYFLGMFKLFKLIKNESPDQRQSPYHICICLQPCVNYYIHVIVKC